MTGLIRDGPTPLHHVNDNAFIDAQRAGQPDLPSKIFVVTLKNRPLENRRLSTDARQRQNSYGMGSGSATSGGIESWPEILQYMGSDVRGRRNV